MFGPRIPNVAMIKREEPMTEVARRAFDFETVLLILFFAEFRVNCDEKRGSFLPRKDSEKQKREKKARDARFGTPSKTDHTQRHERKQRIRYT